VTGGEYREWEVFISYARRASGEHARALSQALHQTGVSVFLDTRDEAAGDAIVRQVFGALAGSRIVVIFAHPAYFRRRYCVEELTMALAAYGTLRGRDAARGALEDAVLPVVVAVPEGGEAQEDLRLLPPEVLSQNWPHENDTRQLARLVRERLQLVHESVGARLERLGEMRGLQDRLDETIAVPVPKQLGGMPVYHEQGLPPSIGDAFVGRSRELWALHHALAMAQHGAAAPAVTLEGGGGFGKTRLALEYLHRYGPPEYPGGLFWVNAEVAGDRIEAQQHAILTLLRPGVPELTAFRASGRDIGRELGEALQDVARSRRVLYVVDNVPEPDGQQPLERVSRWCPAPGQVSLLLTSRASQALASGMHQLEVRELSTPAATMMLLHEYRERQLLSDDSWRQVTAWVGDWPLALELLNASLRAGAVSPRELLAKVQLGSPTQELEKQMEALRGAVAEGALRGVAEAMRMSYVRLPVEMRRAARQLAWLAPSPIPVRLVAHMETPVRARLRVRPFVSDVRSGDVEMYGQMHRVLADFLRLETEDQEGELMSVCTALLGVMTWEACDEPRNWPELNACRPHAEALLERGAEAVAGPALAESLVNLGRAMGRLLRRQGRLPAAVQRGRATLSLARRMLGDEHPTTVATAVSLAWSLRAEDELEEARHLGEWALDLTRHRLGDEHPETLRAIVNLSMTLRNQGETPRARELQERVLEMRRRQFGDDDPDTLGVMGDLADTLRIQGDLERARALQERVLDAWQRRPTQRPQATLEAMARLAVTLREQREVGPARTLQEEVLRERLHLLGEAHPHTLSAMADLAATMRQEGDLEPARELDAQVLDARRRLLGDGHPSTESAMRSLVATMRAQGQHEQAKELEEQVLEAGRRLRARPGPD
jgi:hypothetical protein